VGLYYVRMSEAGGGGGACPRARILCKLYSGMIKVRWERTTTEIDRPRMRVDEILKTLDILPEGVVVAINGEVVSEDEVAVDGDEVRIIKAISGG